MQNKMLTLEFSNIGPFSGITKRIDFKTGITILGGTNGIGKSCLVNAALAAVNGQKLNATLARTPAGDPVRLPAAVTEVGVGVIAATNAKGRQVDALGSSVASAAHDALTLFLTGDNIVDPIKADACRLRALVTLLPGMASVGEEDVEAFVPDTEARSTLVSGASLGHLGVLALKDWLKDTANRKALDAEQKALVLEGTLAAQRTTLSGSLTALNEAGAVDSEKIDRIPSLELDHNVAFGSLAVKRSELDKRLGLEKVKEALGERPDASAEIEEVKQRRSTWLLAGNNVGAKLQTVVELEQQLSEAKAALVSAKDQESAAESALDSAIKAEAAKVAAVAKHDIAMASLQDLDTLATGEDVAAVEARVSELAIELEDARGHKAILEKRQSLTERAEAEDAAVQVSRQSLVELTALGKAMRKQALSIEANLKNVLVRKGLPEGIELSEGRIYQNGVLFEDRSGSKPALSDGQRVATVLDIAVSAFPESLICLDETWYAKLAPAVRLSFAEACVERGILAVTMQPSDSAEIEVSYLP